MSVLKHLKTLQHVSIIIQIIFRELAGSLLKSLNLKAFQNVESQPWCCGSITLGVCVCVWKGVLDRSPHYATTTPRLIFYIKKNLNSVTLTRNLRAP